MKMNRDYYEYFELEDGSIVSVQWVTARGCE